jgi:hypothetical protein
MAGAQLLLPPGGFSGNGNRLFYGAELQRWALRYLWPANKGFALISLRDRGVEGVRVGMATTQLLPPPGGFSGNGNPPFYCRDL